MCFYGIVAMIAIIQRKVFNWIFGKLGNIYDNLKNINVMVCLCNY